MVLAVLILASCVSVSRSVLTEEFATMPVPRAEVDVLMASVGDSLPNSCTRVAILHASGNQEFSDEGDVLEKLRDEAGKLGANTVFVQGMEDAGTGERFAGALFGTGVDRDSDAIAFRCPTDPR